MSCANEVCIFAYGLYELFFKESMSSFLIRHVTSHQLSACILPPVAVCCKNEVCLYAYGLYEFCTMFDEYDIYINVYMCTYIYTPIYMYIYIYIYIVAPPPPSSAAREGVLSDSPRERLCRLFLRFASQHGRWRGGEAALGRRAKCRFDFFTAV